MRSSNDKCTIVVQPFPLLKPLGWNEWLTNFIFPKWCLGNYKFAGWFALSGHGMEKEGGCSDSTHEVTTCWARVSNIQNWLLQNNMLTAATCWTNSHLNTGAVAALEFGAIPSNYGWEMHNRYYRKIDKL